MGDHLSGQLEVNGHGYHLPAGEWRVAAASGYVGGVKDVYTEHVSESNPHGRLFLFDGDNSGLRRLFMLTIPLAPVANGGMISRAPGLCQADWSQSTKLWQDPVSLDSKALDCSAVYYGKVFNWGDDLVNQAKFGLKQLGVPYSQAANFLLTGSYVSQSVASRFMTYGVFVDEAKYADKADFSARNAKLLNDFNAEAAGVRRAFHQDAGKDG